MGNEELLRIREMASCERVRNGHVGVDSLEELEQSRLVLAGSHFFANCTQVFLEPISSSVGFDFTVYRSR